MNFKDSFLEEFIIILSATVLEIMPPCACFNRDFPFVMLWLGSMQLRGNKCFHSA